MRIMVAAPSFGVYGGIEAFALTLAEWLEQNTPHEVRVCFKVVSGCEVSTQLARRCAGIGVSYQFVTRASLRLLADIRWADVVHSNTCSADIAVLSKLAGRPLVLTVHNWFRGKRGLRHYAWYRCHRLADWRTYNSRFVQSSWEPRGPGARSELIPTVCQFPHREVPPSERRGFFFVARLIENKGVDVLVRAYERARFAKDRWPLTIAGEGPLDGWLRAYIARHNVVGVEVIGFIPEEEKAQRMAGARWLVAPSNTKEDMGLTPIEARHVSVPAIVTRDGGLPEAGGPAALLCAPGDPVELAATLECAAGMSMAEYGERAALAKESLRSYLRPMSDYLAIYQRVTAGTRLSPSRAI
jgi:glycosyltransferase involved in cell wall biosynthesis